MRKTFLQFLVVLAVFFCTWLGLSRIDFVRIFDVEKVSRSTEQKIGDAIYGSISETETEALDTTLTRPLQKIKLALCEANNIDPKSIKIHLIKKDEINAFALPDGHLIVYSKLITDCDSPEELCGVLGHEIAHIEHHHVMKKLVREVGLAALLTIGAGKNGGEIIVRAIKLLSSSAYDRNMETDADKTSVDYMVKANIDPTPFVNFLYDLSTNTNLPKQFYWISDHPESEARAKALTEYLKTKTIIKRPLLDNTEWQAFKDSVSVGNF